VYECILACGVLGCGGLGCVLGCVLVCGVMACVLSSLLTYVHRVQCGYRRSAPAAGPQVRAVCVACVCACMKSLCVCVYANIGCMHACMRV
jgi:hypothetical protein